VAFIVGLDARVNGMAGKITYRGGGGNDRKAATMMRSGRREDVVGPSLCETKRRPCAWQTLEVTSCTNWYTFLRPQTTNRVDKQIASLPMNSLSPWIYHLLRRDQT